MNALALLALGSLFAPSKTTAIVGGNVVDGTGAPAIYDATVVIEGDRITDVGPRAVIAVPAGATVIDAKDKWIIPGLIDAHVHFFQSGGLFTRPDAIDLRATRSYADELAWIKQRLPNTFARYIACGVTSVADVGGPFWNFTVRKQASESKCAPRVAVAGPLVSTYFPEALKCDDPAIIKVDTPDQARDLVKRLLDKKPDLVKVWFIYRPGDKLEALKPTVAAAIEASHAGGVRVAVHATELEVARAAVELGCDVLVHSVGDKPVDQPFIDALLAKHVVYTTTLVVQGGYAQVLGQDVELNDIEQRLGDPEVIATWRELPKLRPDMKQHARPPTSPVALANLKKLQDAGVTIAAGTDAGNIGTLHGPSLHHELELMASAGLTPMQVLVAATSGAAKVMAREPEMGTIAKGKLADLLILSENPLDDIRNTSRIERVIKGGVTMEPMPILSAGR
jgi:imidazolonepropionase-like amidohydrolase